MNRYRSLRVLITGILFGSLLASCGPSAPFAGSSSNVNAWIDQPITGSTIPMASFTLKGHARHGSGSGITRIDFLVNSVPIGSVPTDASQPLAYAEAQWNPAAPGLYRIQVQAFAGGDSNYSQLASVCVSQEAKEISSVSLGECSSSAATSEAPSVKPDGTSAPGGALQVKGGADASAAYYGQCTKEQTVVSFDAAPSDMANVRSVAVAIEWRNAAGNPLATEEIAMSTAGADAFQASLDLSANAPAKLGGDSGLVYFSFVVRDVSGASLYRGNAAPIQILPCSAIAVTVPPGPPPPGVTSTSEPPAPPPTDNTPPAVSITSVSSSDVYYTTGCGANSLTVQAQASDASGIASVQLLYGYVGSGTEGIFVAMTPVGGDTYQANINVGGEAYTFLGGVDGQLSLGVEALDNNGNTGSASGGTVKVYYCPG